MLNFFVTQSRLKDGLGCQKSSTRASSRMREEWREGGKGRSEGGKGARVRGREGRSEGAREEGKKDEGGGREGEGGRTRMRREEGTTGAMAVTAVGV